MIINVCYEMHEYVRVGFTGQWSFFWAEYYSAIIQAAFVIWGLFICIVKILSKILIFWSKLDFFVHEFGIRGPKWQNIYIYIYIFFFFFYVYLVCPIWQPIFLYFLFYEPELGIIGIDPGMAVTPHPCNIWKRRDSNPQPFACEPSSLTTTPSSRSKWQKICAAKNEINPRISEWLNVAWFSNSLKIETLNMIKFLCMKFEEFLLLFVIRLALYLFKIR